MNPFKRLAARTIAKVMAGLKSNPQFRDLYASLTYEAINRDQFAGVSEQEKCWPTTCASTHTGARSRSTCARGHRAPRRNGIGRALLPRRHAGARPHPCDR